MRVLLPDVTNISKPVTKRVAVIIVQFDVSIIQFPCLFEAPQPL